MTSATDVLEVDDATGTPPVLTRPRRVKNAGILLLTSALLAGGAADALAQGGTISGRVTSSTTSLGLPNTEIHFYDLNSNADSPTAIATTDAQGDYSINLPPGEYGFITHNTQGYINEIFDNVQCSAVCDVNSLTPVTVTNGSSFTANFALDPGGRIAGRVTDSATGLGIAGVIIFFLPATGDVAFTRAVTDAMGDYLSDGGTVTGTVYAFTVNALGYQNEAWDNVPCGACDPTEVGTPMPVTIGVTTGGYDFALAIGGRITGTVRNASLVPLANVEITIFDSTGENVESGFTDASGNYTSGGLLTGSYYVGTQNGLGLVDRIWNNIPCANARCNPTQGGTLVAVVIGGATGGVDFILAPGGRITGTVTNAVGGAPLGTDAFVGLGDATGTFIGGANINPGTGAYTIRGVPPGTYYANISNVPGFFNQLYNNITCTNACGVLQSTPIHVAANATTANINFALMPTSAVGSISGTVTDTSTGLPVNALNIQVFLVTGAFVASANTNASGVYTVAGLPVTSYYVRTNGGGALINQLHNGVVCINCTVTTSGGTLVPVTNGGVTTINFALSPGGRISGTVTNAVGGAALQNIAVALFSATGVGMGSYTTNASGVYTTRGLPDGTYFLRTSNTQGFVDKLFDNKFCPGPGCAVTTGTPVVVAGTGTVGGRDFSLVLGGRISGTVTNAVTGAPIPFVVSVQVFTEAGVSLGSVSTDASGNYLTFGLPAGRFYLRTANSLGLLDELFDNLPCVGNCSVTAGTPVDVTVGATASGRNFALSQGGNISGTVRDAGTTALLAQVRVTAHLADGTTVKSAATNANGEYVVVGLPAGTYHIRTSNVGIYYLDELYNELPCSPTCTVSAGEPIVVSAGATEGGRNFTLTPGGGAFSGTVSDATTGLGLGGVFVQVHLPDGTPVKTVGTTGTGTFVVALPAGTYHARTGVSNAGAYLDELFNELPCTPTCDVTAGALITVTNGATQAGIDFTLAPNLVRNSRFESGTLNWSLFATPDMSYIVSQVTGGVFEYYRVTPPPATANQAVIFQVTGVALGANAPLVARFSLGNSSSVRKRISVLVLDSDFSDLSVCTFWLAPNTALTPYAMRTHTTKAWTSAAIYFYAASAGSNGGFYRLDNVSLEHVPAGSSTETMCVDPTAPVAPGGPPGPEWLVNGNFNTGTLAPWGEFGTITWQIVAGVLEFIRPSSMPPAGVILQPTGQAAAAGDILTATFQLGNSSGVRKRVTIILHDLNFSDLSACTFWLAPGQPLSDYTYRTFATQAWTNATLSVYPATTGADQWIRLDNATFRRTPGSATVGTECREPGAGPIASPDLARGAPAGSTGSIAGGSVDRSPSGDGWRGGGFTRDREGTNGGWTAVASGGPAVLERVGVLDLSEAARAALAFRSRLPASASWGEVQVRGEAGQWTTVHVVGGEEAWTTITIDLSAYLGQVVNVRFVFHGAASFASAVPDFWRIQNIVVDVATRLRSR